MGIINWVQNRLTGKPEKKSSAASAAATAMNPPRNAPTRDSCQEAGDEIGNDHQWPHGGLLSIGTLGGGEAARREAPGDGARASQDLPDFTMEEVKKLQEALTKLLRRRSKPGGGRRPEAAEELPLDRFLNCPSSLEVDRRRQAAADGEEGGGGGGDVAGDLSPNTKIILSKARELLINSNTAAIKQKSFKFLLKKLFVCGGAGFSPAASLKDPVESRMEKFFRTVLHKKMNVRPSNAASSKKYFLEDKPKEKARRDRRGGDEEEEKGEDSFRWDKTDSDFIVLEI